MRRQHGASFNLLKKLTHDQDPSTARGPARRIRCRRIRAGHAALGIGREIAERSDSGDAGYSRNTRHTGNARGPDRRHGRITGHTGNARDTCDSGHTGPQGQRARIGRFGHVEVTH
jgi:hypothetical protein